ncbi:response regulator transcription factor [bacterium]|nr:response regulator transcription factor [bacterium]
MLRCVVVDDEQGAVDILRDYIGQTPDMEMGASFRDPVEALNYITRNGVDLAFLDIDMPNLSGMQLAELLRERKVMIVFSTAYAEFAVESYEKNAVDYLLKPVPYERFLKAVERARSAARKTSPPASAGGKNIFFVKSGSRIHQLDMDYLLFMKTDGHYVEFHSVHGTVLSRMTMDELLAGLPAGCCARVHKSYVAVLDKIETIERDHVLIAGKEIPIGRSYREEFLKQITYAGN